MKHATVKQIRRLRDGRQLTEIACCPYCQAGHWLMASQSTLTYCPCGPNRPVLLDGLGTPTNYGNQLTKRNNERH